MCAKSHVQFKQFNLVLFRPKTDDPFASLGALTGIAPKAAPAKAPSMNQQQQNQFNNYMQNNVGAPAAPSVSGLITYGCVFNVET